ncbi:hypothetical protein [sulfur-oxidizing endosymbiont of Gigantopelta aegis]|uniref:hypothetical protein n=1 Tax=sulfur-oxidizing endosymbiont of Gigantopelta aegis TaxID=2794934 RepID=UPI0018DE4487|nr:hypothetical protein [sulfur-oxidizing endosymbiont of Gigantopelta aegis]
MYKLQLRLPKIKFAAEQANKVTPKGVNEWLQKIDFSNNSKAHSYFLETLKKINRIDLDVTIRMEVMDILEPTIKIILDETIQKSTSTSGSLNEKNLEISKQIQFLLVEISAAYKIIIKQITDNDDLMAKTPR